MTQRFPSSRRRFLRLGLGGAAAIPLSQISHQCQLLASQSNQQRSLAERAAAKGLIYGAATQDQLLRNDPAFAERFLQECRMLVTENDLQWNQVHPEPERFDFRAADELAAFAKRHGLQFRCHNLVWQNSLPDWFTTEMNHQNAEQMLVKHIETVVGRYAGQVHSWDVVNEAVEPGDNRTDRLRRTPWLEFLGTEYIDLAFRVAAAADPNAMLVYNDYGLEYDNPENEAKRQGILNLLEQLQARGTPIDGLGIQAHLLGHETRFNPEKLSRFLADVASMGLKILISELDVIDNQLSADPRERDQIVAAAYGDFLSVALDQPAVISVTTWGLSDRYTWLTYFHPRSDGQPVRPLPLDQDLKPKLAWEAIARAFDQAPGR
jgi:endo-1,4-beta-xylanase